MNKKNNFPFWRNKTLTLQERNELLKETFRRVFNTDDGKIVLNALLADLHLFDICHTKREHTLNEYAKFFIRERLGVSDTKELTDFIAQTAGSEGG